MGLQGAISPCLNMSRLMCPVWPLVIESRFPALYVNNTIHHFPLHLVVLIKVVRNHDSLPYTALHIRCILKMVSSLWWCFCVCCFFNLKYKSYHILGLPIGCNLVGGWMNAAPDHINIFTNTSIPDHPHISVFWSQCAWSGTCLTTCGSITCETC